MRVVAAVVAAPGSTAIAQSQRFSDVPADHYAFQAIEWAAEAGVTDGYDDGTFKPQRPLSKRHAVVFMEIYYDKILKADQSDDFTRGDMMVLLKAINDGTRCNTGTPPDPASGAAGAAQSQRFHDVPADHYAFQAVEWAAEAGVTVGYPADGTFKPQRPLSKRHAVVFMEIYYDKILKADQSEDFTRGDMMVLLKAMNDGTLCNTVSAKHTHKAVTAGGLHTCAIKTDNTITCWGYNDHGRADAPAGTYKAVTASDHTCAIRTDDTITCWGWNHMAQADSPGSAYRSVSASGGRACAIRADDTLTCWHGTIHAPAGTYRTVSAGASFDCAIRTDDTITCWGNNDRGQTDAPTGAYKAVTAGRWHTCALKTDDTITCWGNNWSGTIDAPTGTYKAVSAGGGHTCAIRTDDTITCWGGLSDAPAGTYKAVSDTCAITADNTIECWIGALHTPRYRTIELPAAPNRPTTEEMITLPVPADDATTADPLYTTADVLYRRFKETNILGTHNDVYRPQTEGNVTIPVFFCGRENYYTPESRRGNVRDLNENVGEPFTSASAGRLTLTFTEGGVLSSDILGETAGTLLDNVRDNPNLEDSPCVREARRLSDAERMLILSPYPSGECVGFARLSHGIIMLSADYLYINSGLDKVAGMVASMVMGLEMNLPVGRFTNGTYNLHRTSWFLLDRDDEHRPIMPCHYSEQLGWPVDGDDPPCKPLEPSRPRVYAAGDGGQFTATWDRPSFTDGVPITGYTVKLIESYFPAGGGSVIEGIERPVAEYHVAPDERSHTFDVPPPTNTFADLHARGTGGLGVIVQAHSQHGTSGSYWVNSGGGIQFGPHPAQTTPYERGSEIVRVTNLSPTGFTLSWDPLPGATEYRLSGFFYSYVSTYSSSATITEDTTYDFPPGVEPDTTYSIRIDACGENDDCVPYTSARVTTPGVATPGVTTPAEHDFDVIVGDTWIDIVPPKEGNRLGYGIFEGTELDSRGDEGIPELELMASGNFRYSSLKPDTTYTLVIVSCEMDESDATAEPGCTPLETMLVTTKSSTES